MNRILKVLLMICLCTGLFSVAFSQQQTGSVKGTITDNEGNPLPGVTVTVSSPALMRIQTFTTTETGAFRFPALPPGTYTLRAELPGHKTIDRGNIVVRVGMTITLDLTMEMTAVEEEVTVTAASPTVDVQSTKLTVTMDRELLKNIPMARDLYDIVNSAPGAVSEGVTYRRTSSIHGSTVRGNTYAFDGVNMNDPVVMYPLTNINFDVMDEVEMITAGHTASVGYTDGAYINIVTKSGGNKFSGGAVVYYTNDGFAQHLWTDEQVGAMGVSKPSVEKKWFDGSLTLGGPVLKDKIWFFANGRYITNELRTNFIPFTDVFGHYHGPYDWTHEEKMGFGKLTAQLSSKLKLMAMFNYVDIYRPMYEQPGPYVAFMATRIWDHEKGTTLNGVLNYVLNQNTFIDLRVGYVSRLFPLPMQKEAQDLPWVQDYSSNYFYITSARFNEIYLRKRFQTGAYLTSFKDNFLGSNHEFKAGAEIETAYGDWDWWRKDNMIWDIDTRNPNNYYYSDRGRLRFYICGPDKGSTKIIDQAMRIGGYIQDSATFANRLTLNVGLRFDYSTGWKPAVSKTAGGNPISVFIGETIVSPYIAATYPDNFPNGLNPWGDATSPEWKDIISWNSFSPRFGLTYDVFGNGKTAFKFSFNRYTEYLMLQYFSTLHPFYPRNFTIFWTDTNSSGAPDLDDSYVLSPTDFRAMDPEFAKNRIDPNTTSPLNDEWVVGVWHELFNNFSVGLNFIYKDKKNIVETANYAPDTDEYWYHPDQETVGRYYIPFTTTVPGTDDYPDETVTIYVRSNDAPPGFTRFTNIPELKRKYWAFEFIFNKRMADGWQLNGSVCYTKAYGNIGGNYGSSWGWSGLGSQPNGYVNADGRLDVDRPLQIRLMGTARLPFQVFLSAYYQYQSGPPWTRQCNIRPPASWCTANNAYRVDYFVNLEPQGSRRLRAFNSLDLRLEKEFRIGNVGRLGAYVDVRNVMGYSNVNIGLNDIYRWSPNAEGANQPGTATTTSTYRVISSVDGVRDIRFSLRFNF